MRSRRNWIGGFRKAYMAVFPIFSRGFIGNIIPDIILPRSIKSFTYFLFLYPIMKEETLRKYF
jgi:hypothetical protein